MDAQKFSLHFSELIGKALADLWLGRRHLCWRAIRIDFIIIVPGRWPRHLVNVWHG